MDAERVVAAVIAGRKKFGNMYGLGEFTAGQILDALVEVSEKGDLAGVAHAEELTKVKRQLTASKAREAKAKKKIAKLTEERDAQYEQNVEQIAQIAALEADVAACQQEIDALNGV